MSDILPTRNGNGNGHAMKYITGTAIAISVSVCGFFGVDVRDRIKAVEQGGVERAVSLAKIESAAIANANALDEQSRLLAAQGSRMDIMANAISSLTAQSMKNTEQAIGVLIKFAEKDQPK